MELHLVEQVAVFCRDRFVVVQKGHPLLCSQNGNLNKQVYFLQKKYFLLLSILYFKRDFRQMSLRIC